MPDAAPGGAAGVWPAGSLVVLWKRNMEIGVRDANTSHVTSPASPVRRCFTSGQHTIAGCPEVRQQESTLAIRAVHQGTTMPDGFSIWHHLDAHGIPFKSITPKTTLC